MSRHRNRKPRSPPSVMLPGSRKWSRTTFEHIATIHSIRSIFMFTLNLWFLPSKLITPDHWQYITSQRGPGQGCWCRGGGSVNIKQNHVENHEKVRLQYRKIFIEISVLRERVPQNLFFAILFTSFIKRLFDFVLDSFQYGKEFCFGFFYYFPWLFSSYGMSAGKERKYVNICCWYKYLI